MDASYKNDYRSVAGEIIMLANKKTMDVFPIYWKSGVIKSVYVTKGCRNKSVNEDSG